MFLDCLPVWQLHPCPHAQFIDFILLFTISKLYWSKTLPRSLLLHNEWMTVKMLKTLTGISVCMKTWTVQNNPLRSELDIDWFIMSVTRCCHLKWLWTMLQSNDWFAPTLFLSSVFHIVCENMDSMNLTDGETKAVLPCITAVSLHIRTPCFKPKRSPYLFTFVFCVSSCTWSVSFQVSGLPKPKTSSQSQTARVQTLGPARVSGLRKRSLNLGKKFPSVNNENNPGVQATISSLWRNFSFKK